MTKKSKENESIRVLMLEDEDALAQLYCKKLETAGFNVQLFEESDDLLKHYKKFDPQIAFLDHALHGENKSGMDIIPVIKKSHPDTKIVMLSNYSEFQMEQAAKDAGADDYLLKINTPPAALAEYAQKLASKL